MEYEIIDGVRRAKAAQVAGHVTIRARLYDWTNGSLLAEMDVPIDALRSPHKTAIRRVTQTDEHRWRRAETGAHQSSLPFPPIDVCAGSRGIRVQDIAFDFGGAP